MFYVATFTWRKSKTVCILHNKRIYINAFITTTSKCTILVKHIVTAIQVDYSKLKQAQLAAILIKIV